MRDEKYDAFSFSPYYIYYFLVVISYLLLIMPGPTQ
jgi:hypothetical protein